MASTLESMARGAELLAGWLTALLLLILCLTIVLRDGFGLAYAWVDDVLRYMWVWTVYLAAVRLSMRNDHITVDALYLRLPGRLRRWVDRLIGVTSMAVCLYITYLGYGSLQRIIGFGQRSNSGALPAFLGYGIIPVGFLLTAAAFLHFLVRVSGRSEPAAHDAGFRR